MTHPRPKQQEVLAYRRGRMGVSAVPGSGKTWTLSQLAADLVVSRELRDDQEVLIVTLVNSAVDNFYRVMRERLKTRSLLTFLGYRVRTLHGLSHDIVRERPALVGLADNFQIVDEREANSIREEAALAWLRAHPAVFDGYLSDELEDYRRESVRRQELPEVVSNVALSLIRYSKDRELTPEALRQKLEAAPMSLPLAAMAGDIYADYQRALAYRGAVDFDDLIRLALLALKTDAQYLERLRSRWPYILEDEAQDSNRLQEEMLRLLAGPGGNWVRVGDPNQAIYETFTTASPEYLLRFLEEPGVLKKELPDSGRSQPSIIRLANYLVAWTRAQHPVAAARTALAPAVIEPVPPDDPQPNPPDDPGQVRLVAQKHTPDREVSRVAESIQNWLPEHRDWTVAALVPRNTRGFELVDELKRRGLEVVDSLLQSTMQTRRSADVVAKVLEYLADPLSPHKLARVFEAWKRADREDEAAWARVQATAKQLGKCRQVEDYLWPKPDRDWLDETGLAADEPEIYADLLTFRDLVQRWQGTILLPIDQAILTVAQDLFTDTTELALAHKLAVTLRRAADGHPAWRLPELAGELATVARNERRFLGFSDDDTGFDPEAHKGKVVVATMHKAKGLEWDRVYLMSVNNYDFPSGQEYDEYIAERWFIRDRLSLEAEALGQLKALVAAGEYREGQATLQARLDYVRERLRLFYVGLTRAKRELVVTWNTGRKDNLQPALPFAALQAYWEKSQDGAPA